MKNMDRELRRNFDKAAKEHKAHLKNGDANEKSYRKPKMKKSAGKRALYGAIEVNGLQAPEI